MKIGWIGSAVPAVVLITTATSSWVAAPLWTWFGIAAFHGSLEAWWGADVADPFFDEQSVLMPATLEREADLRRLVDFTERRWRARYYVPVAVVIAVLILAAGAVVAPDDVVALPPPHNIVAHASADDIVAKRTAHPFTTVEELKAVKGVNVDVIQKLAAKKLIAF